MQVPLVLVIAQALPDAVAMAVGVPLTESSPVVDVPPLGVYLPIWTDPVPLTVGAAAVPVSTPVPPMRSTSTMVAAPGITQRPENCAAISAVALCVSLSIM